MKFLSALGDIKKVFLWLSSNTGQKVITTGEAIAEAVYPPATGIITIANSWLTEIIKSEAMANAAGVSSGSGAQKAALVLSAEAPQIIAFAKQHGLPNPTAEQIQAMNDALVAFLNAFNAK